MRTYTVPEPAEVEMPDAFGERFRLEFKAGKRTPKSEREELALEHLVSIGAASSAEGKPASAPEEG